MKGLYISIFLLSLVLSSCSSTGKEKRHKAIAKDEAIKIATDYVIEQGYTDVPIKQIDPSKIVFEQGEFASDTLDIIKGRHNSIKLPAYGSRAYKKKTEWAVGFEYIQNYENVGRYVVMDSLGNGAFMSDKQIRLDWLIEEL